MAALRARLFGRFSVHCSDRELLGFEAGKVKELLAFLLLRRGHPLTREYLAEQLWNDSANALSLLADAHRALEREIRALVDAAETHRQTS